jgi:hypothetical protein
MIAVITLLLAFIIVIVVLLFRAKKLKAYKFGFLLLITAVGFLILGTILIIHSSNEISKELQRHSWPTIKATVIDTHIVGEKAYQPQISCKYEVGGKTFTLVTDLNTPGFGRKYSRHQTAEIILHDYPLGSNVVIRYNPENPGEAYIRTGPYWSDYTQLSLGLFIFIPGFYLILGKFFFNFGKAITGKTSN